MLFFSVHEIKISNKCVKTRENKRKHNFRSKGGKGSIKNGVCITSVYVINSSSFSHSL